MDGNKTALVLIATGSNYWSYATDLIESAKRYFVPHDVILFTDRGWGFGVHTQTYLPDLGYPMATLMRYRAICSEQDILSKYEYVFYCDVDMRWVAPVTEDEIFSDGITATEHPGLVGLPGPFETRSYSTAYCPRGGTYFCGGFNGGTSEAYLNMARSIRQSVDIDLSNGVVALWHDESHLNRYLYDNPPAKILTPAFCWPDPVAEGTKYAEIWAQANRGVPIVPKLLALKKTSGVRNER